MPSTWIWRSSRGKSLVSEPLVVNASPLIYSFWESAHGYLGGSSSGPSGPVRSRLRVLSWRSSATWGCNCPTEFAPGVGAQEGATIARRSCFPADSRDLEWAWHPEERGRTERDAQRIHGSHRAGRRLVYLLFSRNSWGQRPGALEEGMSREPGNSHYTHSG